MNEEVKENSDFTSLYCVTQKGNEFIGYMNVPNAFTEAVTAQLLKAKILAEVSDPTKRKERSVPTF